MKETTNKKEVDIAVVKVGKEKKERKKLPKDVSQGILKIVFKNLLIAIAIMAYFFILNIASNNMKEERLMGDLKVFSGTFLVVGIMFLEKAYKYDKGTEAIHGIELLVLAAHTLSIMHVITLYKYNFQVYLLTSAYIFSIYYVFKSIVIYTRGKRQYLSSLSDISEIIKEQPQKKDAKKRIENNTSKEEKKETKEIVKNKEKNNKISKPENNEKNKNIEEKKKEILEKKDTKPNKQIKENIKKEQKPKTNKPKTTSKTKEIKK